MRVQMRQRPFEECQGGLLTATAFGLQADVKTGHPKLLSEMTLLTALRTAAFSAMAARHLAPEGTERWR